MSEAVSATPTAVTPTASSNPTPASAGGQTETRSPGEPAQAGESAAAAEDRILSEADLDAFVMQKINGKDEKVKLRDLQKAYGLDKAANQRMQEAASEKKRTQQLMHLMETDPKRYCEVTGKDYDSWMRQHFSGRKDLAEEILAKEYELQQMDPHQREAMELKQQLEAYKTKETAQKQPLIAEIKKIVPESMLPKGLENATTEQLNQFLQVKQQEFQAGLDNLSNELLGAWEKHGLPKQKEMGQWMAQVMSDYNKRTGETLQPDRAAAIVKARFLNSTKSLLSQMDAKAIHETLGEDVIKKLREYDIEQVRSSGPQFGKQENSPAPAASEERKTINQFEFRKWAGIS